MASNNHSQVCRTGVTGLDEILIGGFPKNYLYLIQGRPGTGKTTLAMQFLLEGVCEGEKVLYITFSETKLELEAVARSHAWNLEKIDILELSSFSASVGAATQNSLFHPSEIELNNIIDLLLKKVEEVVPLELFSILFRSSDS